MGITPNNGPTMGGTTVAISCTGDSTAKTFFTAKTAKNAKKFLRILRIQAENLQENLRDINFFFATFASSR